MTRVYRGLRCRPIVTLAVAVLALIVGISGASAKAKPKKPKPVKTYPVKIFSVVQIAPLSGQNAALGVWDSKGISLAAKQLNAKGNAYNYGVKFKIVHWDDQGDPTTANNLAQQAIAKKYDFVYGSALSTNTLAMMPVLQSAKLSQMTSGQSDKILSQGDAFVFMNSTPSSVYDATIAKYVVGTKKYTKIAMLTNNDAYGKSEHDAFLAQLKQRGLEPVVDQVVTPDATDMTGALSKVRDSNPQVLFIGAEEIQSGLAVKQARSLGIKAVIAEGAPAATPLYVSTAGEANVEGTIVSSPYLSNDLNAKTRAFAAAYKKAYGEDPELHGAKAYDGFMILATALRSLKGKWTPSSLSAAIHKVKYSGLLGTFAFDQTGLGLHETQIGVIRKGKITNP
jgi:branched-chain amino acid transport system substrate-binding protein